MVPEIELTLWDKIKWLVKNAPLIYAIAIVGSVRHKLGLRRVYIRFTRAWADGSKHVEVRLDYAYGLPDEISTYQRLIAFDIQLINSDIVVFSDALTYFIDGIGYIKREKYRSLDH